MTDLEERNQDIVRMYREGWSLRAIGEQMGLSHEQVRKVLRKAGVTRRDQGIRSPKRQEELVPS